MKQHVIDGYLEKIKRLEEMNKDLIKREKLILKSDMLRYLALVEIKDIAQSEREDIHDSVKLASIRSLAEKAIREGL